MTLRKTVWAPMAVAAMLAIAPAVPVWADPKENACRARAEKDSGYSEPSSGLSVQSGNSSFQLSGTVAIGVSRSRGMQGGNTAPPFAGDAATERRQAKAKSKFTRIYDACMRAP